MSEAAPGCARVAREFFATGTFQQSLAEQAKYLRAVAAFLVTGVYTYVRDGRPTTVGLRGSSQAELTASLHCLWAADRRGEPALLDGKERLLASRLERLETLQQRLRRFDEAEVNCELVCSEQKRLVEQVKLIRADALAARNADTLAAEIDLSIQHLAATNKWLSELADFADVTAHMPAMPASTATQWRCPQ
jgi:hypothetical protein